MRLERFSILAVAVRARSVAGAAALYLFLGTIGVPAWAQGVGPGPVTGPVDRSAGTSTVLGGTAITSTGANIGINATGGTVILDPIAWIRPSVWKEFLGTPHTRISSATGPVPFNSDIDGTFLQLNAGVSAEVTHAMSLFANVGYDTALDDNNSYDVNGKVGIRFTW